MPRHDPAQKETDSPKPRALAWLWLAADTRGPGLDSIGVMAIDERLTQAIVQRILTVTKPDRIILFGSAATGQMTRDSDIDLRVVAPSPSNTIEERVRLRRSLRGLGFPFDVFIIATERFEGSKNIFGGIAYPAHKHGHAIYKAA